jgi:hypothetical protein
MILVYDTMYYGSSAGVEIWLPGASDPDIWNVELSLKIHVPGSILWHTGSKKSGILCWTSIRRTRGLQHINERATARQPRLADNDDLDPQNKSMWVTWTVVQKN